MGALTQACLSQWPIIDDCLVIGGIPLTRLARRVGRTPFYAYDRALIDQRIAHLREGFPSGVKLHYAIKANPMPALVCYLAQRVDGLDVASAGELRIALDAGVDPAEISFAGPGKSEGELAQAVEAGVLLNIESFRELDVLSRVAKTSDLPARVAVRVNPDFELKSSGMRMGGGAKPFGVDVEIVPQLLREIAHRARITFEGFHVFCGSQNLRADAICAAQEKALDLALRLAELAPAPLRTVNIGGGFGIPYFSGDQPLDISEIGQKLLSLGDRLARSFENAHLVVELGRYIVGEAGIYVCRVVDRKVSRGQVFLVTDGGLHHHLAASGNFGQIIRKNYPVVIGNRVWGAKRERASVVGPLCTPLDLLADQVDLAEAMPGDLVVVFQSGAYGLTASPTAFLNHPPALEALV
jgi:diaminopimelate decarboxylase